MKIQNLVDPEGRGEMKRGQSWETTPDVNARRLMQVKVKHVDEAAEAGYIFVKLMGGLVEPQRDAIQGNALVASVDVLERVFRYGA